MYYFQQGGRCSELLILPELVTFIEPCESLLYYCVASLLVFEVALRPPRPLCKGISNPFALVAPTEAVCQLLARLLLLLVEARFLSKRGRGGYQGNSAKKPGLSRATTTTGDVLYSPPLG